MKVLKPAVDPDTYRAKRLAQAARAAARRQELGSLEHSFARLPELTPRTPRVVTTARNEHPRQDGRKKPLPKQQRKRRCSRLVRGITPQPMKLKKKLPKRSISRLCEKPICNNPTKRGFSHRRKA